jgi:HAD superfamily hydrolase (TIGR01490 family)
METIFSKENNSVGSYIAFFDLDRTITAAISGNALTRAALKKGLMSVSDLAKAVYLSLLYRLSLRDPLKIIDEMVSWTKGISVKTIDDLCFEVFNDILFPTVYSEARSEIKSHKEKNARVVILSSALTPICLNMVKNLEMDDFLCSDIAVVNGYLTGLPIGHLCFGPEKSIRLIEYCEKNNSKTSDAWYYGDSISDLPALSAVGNPVCINPDKKLKKAAEKRGWKILSWSS